MCGVVPLKKINRLMLVSVFLLVTLTLFNVASADEVSTSNNEKKGLYVVTSQHDLTSDSLYAGLMDYGFLIDVSDSIPADMSSYDLVVVSSYDACWQTTADYMKEYIGNGGGAVIVSGCPAMFPHPSQTIGSSSGYFDISYISEWFGTANYQNVGLSDATVTIDNPVGTNLLSGDYLAHCNAWGGAAVSNLNGATTQTLAMWDYSSDSIFAFTNEYRAGKVFYISTYGANQSNNDLALSGALWAAGSEASSNPVDKYALIVGIDNYEDHPDDYDSITGPVNSAEAIYDLLIYGYGYNPQNIVNLTDGEATSEVIVQKVVKFQHAVDSNDIFVFYFAGHGGRSYGEEYIVTYNGYVSSESIDSYFSPYEGTVISIFDSCYSGGMTLDTDINDPPNTRKGFDGDNAIFLMAAEADKTAHGGIFVKQGRFTYNFVKAFTEKKEDSDSRVSLEEAFDYVDDLWYGPIIHINPVVMDHYPTKDTPKDYCYFAETPMNENFVSVKLNCPAHLHAYDSSGRHTGLDEIGGFEENIPGSVYNGPEYDPEEIIILGQSSNLTYKIKGFDEGSFNFTIKRSTEDGITIIGYRGILITGKTVASVVVGPQNQKYLMEIDIDGDGITDSVEEPDFIREPKPLIDVEKFTNGKDAESESTPGIHIGDIVEWKYVITNTGDFVLNNITLVDDREGIISCPKDTLEPGESMECSYEGTAEYGYYQNIAYVTGEFNGITVNDSDTGEYYGFESNNRDWEPVAVPTANPLITIGVLGLFTILLLRKGSK